MYFAWLGCVLPAKYKTGGSYCRRTDSPAAASKYAPLRSEVRHRSAAKSTGSSLTLFSNLAIGESCLRLKRAQEFPTKPPYLLVIGFQILWFWSETLTLYRCPRWLRAMANSHTECRSAGFWKPFCFVVLVAIRSVGITGTRLLVFSAYLEKAPAFWLVWLRWSSVRTPQA